MDESTSLLTRQSETIREFESLTLRKMKGEAIFDRLTHRNKTTGGELTCFTSIGNPKKERSSSEPSSAGMQCDDTGLNVAGYVQSVSIY